MSGPTRKWLYRIHDMIENIAFIKRTLEGVSKQRFLNDEVLQRAIERSFEIIGEAARHVPKSAQEKYRTVEWAEIIGMRHKISHDYTPTL